MSTCRIALANIPFPASPDESVVLAVDAIAVAGESRADLVCFPECYVPGYRAPTRSVPPSDATFLDRAWRTIADAARRANVGVLLGTERLLDDRPLITTLVIDRNGKVAGWQDKVQLDPSEDATYAAGRERRVFTADAVTFGVAICHEGWRYPKPSATPRVAERRSSSSRTSTKQSQEPSGRRRSANRRTHFTRRRCLSRRGEHLLHRRRELRERRLADNLRHRQAGRNGARLAALRRSRPADCRFGPH